MVVTAKQLRIEPGRIISQAESGQEITITYRGKPRAKIVPFVGIKTDFEDQNSELFGIWKDRKDMKNVDKFIRNLRKGRKFC